MDTDLLYSNKYESPTVFTPSTDELKQSWRKYIDSKMEADHKQAETRAGKKLPSASESFKDLSDLSNTHSYRSETTDSLLLTPKEVSQLNGPLPNGLTRYNKPKRSVITIDSWDRDVTKYPNQNQYTINLNTAYENIKSVRLLSTEFPNTNQVIKGSPVELATNVIYWINQEDVGVYPIQPIYSAALTPGNYYSTTLINEMTTQMNSVQRKNGTGPYHNFQIDIDSDTNIVDISSLNTTTLNNPLEIYGSNILTISDLSGSMNIVSQKNPINLVPGDLVFIQAVRTVPDINGQRVVRTITGSDSFTVDNGVGSDVPFISASDSTNMFFSTNLIQVNYPGQPFSAGDNIILSNTTAFDGLTSNVITGEFTVRSIPAPSLNNFYISLTIAGTSLVTGGGSAVQVSTPLPFKFLFSNLDSPGTVLGFDQEDSSETAGTYITGIAAGSPVTVTCPFHNLQPGNIVTITGTNTIPSINGNHTVSRIIDSNTINLNVNVSRIISTDLSNSFLCYSPFTIVNYTVIGYDTTSNSVTTSVPHTLEVGDFMTLFGVFSDPLIVGTPFQVTAVPTSTSVTLDLTPIGKEFSVGNNAVTILPNGLNNASSAVNRLNFHLVDHSLNVGDTLYIYDAEAFAGLSADSINTTHGKMNNFASIKQPVGKSDSVQKEKRNTIITDYELTTTRFVRSVIDANNIVIDISTSPSVNIPGIPGGGNSVSLSGALYIAPDRTVSFTTPVNNLYGFNYTQQNITAHGLLNRVVSIEGDSYILVVSPELNTMDNTGPVASIFAKILLSDPPGTILFNTFVSNEKTFDDNALPSISKMSFSFVDRNGHLFSFSDMDHSFSLEIITYQDTLVESSVSSRRGITDRGINNLDTVSQDPTFSNAGATVQPNTGTGNGRSRDSVNKAVKTVNYSLRN